MIKYTVRHADFVEAVFPPIEVTAHWLPRVGESLQFAGSGSLEVVSVAYLLDKPSAAAKVAACFAVVVWVR